MVGKLTGLSRTIVALDNMSEQDVQKSLKLLQGQLPWFKIGLEQYCRSGRQWLQQLMKEYPFELFLDLKLHDIPNTVARAIEALEGLPVKMLTVHLSGGKNMLEAALEAQSKHLPDCLLLGVSYLTSLDDRDFYALQGLSPEQVPKAFDRLFEVGTSAGMKGFVCSAFEASRLKNLNPEATSVCPGIRFADEITGANLLHDQKRVATPEWALQNGADYLVMGRSLTQTDRLNERIEYLASLKL
jgi:orotidine-5'-phosphate decarboxylase